VTEGKRRRQKQGWVLWPPSGEGNALYEENDTNIEEKTEL